VWHLLLLAVVSAAGCAKSPQDQVSSAVQQIESWAATAQLTGAEWGRGRSPTGYSRRSIAAAGQQLASQQTMLESLARGDTNARAALIMRDSVAAHVSRLEAAIATGNASAARSATNALSRYSAALDSLHERLDRSK
jgi:GrpB-like predicted nucleotidyltransferase (UPF0157 family)